MSAAATLAPMGWLARRVGCHRGDPRYQLASRRRAA
jgi:hypothetical protein